MLNINKVRADFPILSQEIYKQTPLVYLDSAASSQKPTAVIEAMNDYYRQYNANVHRGIHYLSETATNAYEGARDKVAAFINAPAREQIIMVRNATEGFNLLAFTWGRANLGPGDEVLITEMEHHANIVPWQLITEMTGSTLKYVSFTEDGHLDMAEVAQLLTVKTKIFSFTAASNVFGTINPVRQLVDMAHAVGAIAAVDAAQAVPHAAVDVQAWDCDFMAFSGHKMCGPTGIGVLFGKRDLLEAMPPFMGGGDMIRRVSMEKSTWNDLPYKFEAGTPAIAEGIGLGAAVDYLTELGMANVHAHEQMITNYALESLSEVPGLTILGPKAAAERGGLVSFTVDGLHPHDIAQLLDEDGIAIRAGHHCAMPLHKKLGLGASARASFYLHTTREEVDKLIESLHRAREVFRL
ncbi:MAG: cysteine desulfurase [Anaerolineales bacterium]|nr:cysteine desulfurase [Anaerolineales bacterium]